MQTIKEVLSVLIQSTGTSLMKTCLALVFPVRKSFLKYMNQSLETLKMMLEKINLQKLKKECG